MKHSVLIVSLVVVLFSCKEPEARRPKKHSVTNFYKEIIAQNKKLNALESKKIQEIIARDTVVNYKSSNNGFWYAYIQKDSIQTKVPKQNDLVTLTYNITTIFDQPIYNKTEVTYKVDKQDFIPGLQEGIKLMKEGEEIVFIIPSYLAYGVSGDENKIKINQPIKSTVKLNKIEQ